MSSLRVPEPKRATGVDTDRSMPQYREMQTGNVEDGAQAKAPDAESLTQDNIRQANHSAQAPGADSAVTIADGPGGMSATNGKDKGQHVPPLRTLRRTPGQYYDIDSPHQAETAPLADESYYGQDVNSVRLSDSSGTVDLLNYDDSTQYPAKYEPSRPNDPIRRTQTDYKDLDSTIVLGGKYDPTQEYVSVLMPKSWFNRDTKPRNSTASTLRPGKIFRAGLLQKLSDPNVTEQDSNFNPSLFGAKSGKMGYFICSDVLPGTSWGRLMTSRDLEKLSTGLINTRIPTKRASDPEPVTPSPFRCISYTNDTKIPDHLGCVMLNRLVHFDQDEEVKVVGELLPQDVTFFRNTCKLVSKLAEEVFDEQPPPHDTKLTAAFKRHQLKDSSAFKEPPDARTSTTPMGRYGFTKDRKRSLSPVRTRDDATRDAKRHKKDEKQRSEETYEKGVKENRSFRERLFHPGRSTIKPHPLLKRTRKP